MTIREHIQEMLKYPNLDAELNFIVNTHNTDNDAFDKQYMEVSYMEQDKDDVESYDVLVHFSEDVEKQREKHREESICELLADRGKLTIQLDTDNLHKANIVIYDEAKDEVLREISVGGRFRNEENICKMLDNILA